MTKNLQIASAIAGGLDKIMKEKAKDQEQVRINWSNPYDDDSIRGYTGTWV